MSHFEKLKDYVDELGLVIQKVNEAKQLLVVNNIKESGFIQNMILDIEGDVLIIIQPILKLDERLKDNPYFFKQLLTWNNDFGGPGGFVINGTDVLFRAILPIENLDLNELEATVIGLDIGLANWADEIDKFVFGENVA